MSPRHFRLPSLPRVLALCVALLFILSACTRGNPASEPPLLVFAASSLRDALGEIARDYQATGVDSVVLVFGSTGDLSRQIANGAPADLFFAADAESIDALATSGSVVADSREVYAVGQLALIARCTRADTSAAVPEVTVAGATAAVACPRLALRDLASDSLRIIAIADPSHAPYGRATRQALEREGLWTTVSPKLVLGANISQAELFVTSGNADAGIVALSLLQRDSQRVYTLLESSLHDPLVQVAAIVARSTRQKQARAFLTYLRSPSGRAVMQRYGFTTPAANDS